MGCDGGTIPRRDELVRMKKKPEQKDKDAERAFKWRNCALSQQPLQEPIVSCGLGRLYSKSSVLETLLDKESKPESISHIKNMKDIKDLKLVKNPAYKAADRLEGAVDEGSSPYICPISGLEMRGKFRFIYLWSCGCVMAERALKEVKQNICHMCQQPFTDNDVIILNGTDEDIELLKTKMTIRVASRKGTKKSKDSKKCETAVKAEVTTEIKDSKEDIEIIKDQGNEDQTPKSNDAQKNITDAVKIEDIQFQSNKQIEPQAGSSGLNKKELGQETPSCSNNKDLESQSGSSTINKKEIEPQAGSSSSNKKEFETIPLSLPKYNPNKQARGHFGSSKRALSNDLVQDPSYKKTKKDYSVASDPQSSEVFKSLFTSHKSEQEQTRAHWITYNPFYN